MKLLSLLLSLGFVLNLASAFIAVPRQPSNDPFYTPPANISLYKEGDIMKWRRTPSQVRALLYTPLISRVRGSLWGGNSGILPEETIPPLGGSTPIHQGAFGENLIGVAVGGWVTNLTSVVEKIDGTEFAGFVGVGLLGLASEYPAAQSQVFNYIDPRRVGQVKGLYNQCVVGAIVSFVNAKFLKGSSPIFTEGRGVLNKPEIKAMLRENTLASNSSGPVPQVPFFVYHGQPDEVIPFDNSQRVYDTWCSQGIASMEFAVSQTSGHLVEFAEGGGAAIQWLSKRFNGDAPVKGCSRTVRKSNLDYPGADQSFYAITRTTIEGIFQQQLGPLLFGRCLFHHHRVRNLQCSCWVD
ncbi:hypothetical protein JCM33374_g3604 [Metschnikowia sp. JCM 33374]|nr:hypothetical protein JCM33374_g3604 [Metschnikowia sp. JCM 33374]